jgi:AcrR family transcriptional regulator
VTAGAAGRRGRRPGSPDTRAAILAAARSRFADAGFGGTTIRGVAADAGVDPALVHHYFGSKDELFLAAMELPVDPRELILARVLEPPAARPEELGERLLRTFLSAWDDPELQPALVAIARRAFEPGGDTMIRDGFIPVVLIPTGKKLGIDHPETRMPVVASQMMGLIFMRYLLRAEPIVSMDTDRLVATYAPTLQHYLTGPLPG